MTSPETETLQAEIGAEFYLPNGKSVRLKPVPFPAARRIIALLYEYDRTGDYVATLQRAVEEFAAVTGLDEAEVLAACPTMTLGDFTTAMMRFFFHRHPITGTTEKPPPNGKAPAGA